MHEGRGLIIDCEREINKNVLRGVFLLPGHNEVIIKNIA